MARDDRVATWFLLVSVLLHLGLLIPLPLLQIEETRPTEEGPRAQYVVRLPQPALRQTPPPPVPKPLQPLEPPAMAAAVQPRQPQPVDISQPRQERTSVPEITPSPQPRPVQPDTPDTITPRPPMPTNSHAAVVRRHKLPALPPLVQLPTFPAEDPTRHRPVPRQPSTQWQQAIVPPAPSMPPGEQDPLATYLAEVRAAIDRHKRYPAAARLGSTGSVVLQFVILPDGRVIEPSVAETDGHRAFGAAALDSLRRASPMPPFPETIVRDRLMVRVPISYKLTE